MTRQDRIELWIIAAAALYFGVTVLVSSAQGWIKYPAGFAFIFIAAVAAIMTAPRPRE